MGIRNLYIFMYELLTIHVNVFLYVYYMYLFLLATVPVLLYKSLLCDK